MKAGEEMRIDRKKLILAMLEKNHNVLQLAKASGISRVTISSIRSGKSCSPVTAKKIAAALNVPIENLIEN